MRSILLLSALVGIFAVPAKADDFSIAFGYRSNNRWAVNVGFSNDKTWRRPNHRYVPGHYETVERQVWVPGTCEQVWQPAQYGWGRDHCGRRVRVLVRPAGYVTVQRPGHYECVHEQVWVPGRYVRC